MPNNYPYPSSPTIDFTEVIPSGTSALQARPKVNGAYSALDQGLQRVVTDWELLNLTYLGAGRFTGTDPDEGTPVMGTGLTLRLQNGLYLVQGRPVRIANSEPNPYQVVTGILANKPSGVEVFVGIDAKTGALVTSPSWQFDALPSTAEEIELVAGLLHVGRAVTSGSAVTSFTASEIEGRGIISPRGTATGGGGEGPGSIYVGATPYLYLSTDLRPLKDVLDSLVADLQAQIDALNAKMGETGDAFPSFNDQLADEIAINRAGLAEVNPIAIERGQISVVMANAGHGQFGTPDYTPTTGDANELAYNAIDGTFGI